MDFQGRYIKIFGQKL